MNVKSVEKENGNAKIAIEIEKAEFEVALNKAYASIFSFSVTINKSIFNF